MGEAARRLAHTAAPARPALRLVATPGRHPRSRRRTLGVAHIALVCCVIIGVSGFARVALAAQAAEAAVDAWGLRDALRVERQTARSLEADRSSLAAPSRIEALACETLNMDRPVEVCYLELPAAESADVPDEPAAAPESGGAPGDAQGPTLLATLVDLAADEAQALLVGDMGLGEAW